MIRGEKDISFPCTFKSFGKRGNIKDLLDKEVIKPVALHQAPRGWGGGG